MVEYHIILITQLVNCGSSSISIEFSGDQTGVIFILPISLPVNLIRSLCGALAYSLAYASIDPFDGSIVVLPFISCSREMCIDGGGTRFHTSGLGGGADCVSYVL